MAPRKEKVDKTSSGGGGNAEALIVNYLSMYDRMSWLCGKGLLTACLWHGLRATEVGHLSWLV